jgi:DNA (cytosine-5)-methyltransferase 1
MHLFPYEWNLKDGYPSKNIKPNNLNVFGTFINGGGSSMGYKLAGYNHLGGVEIDPQVADIYKTNHNPKHLYVDDIREFNKRTDLPKELYELDILDGSPPCSTFSMAGSREAAWGKEKVFREGQAKQTLDDLVFVYIETINKLRPKVAILENVKGMIAGNAKAYVKEANKRLDEYGYNVQIFLLNSATMGVPQKRERVFFICSKKELKYPKLKLNFNESVIPFREIENGTIGKPITGQMLKYWELCPEGNALSKVHPKGNYFGSIKIGMNKVCNTVIASNSSPILHNKKPNYISDDNLCQIGSYPKDYMFKKVDAKYLIGMSVPPVMVAQISHQIFLQWFSK